MLRKNALRLEAASTERASADGGNRIAAPLSTPVVLPAGKLRPVQGHAPGEMEAGHPCTACAVNGLNLCALARTDSGAGAAEAGNPACPVPARIARARRTICHPRDVSDLVTVICSGWAAAVIGLPDGRRQIVSFLLPGDVVSSASLLHPVSGRSVETITDVTYRQFKRDDIKAALVREPALLNKVARLLSEEREQADRMAVDLGCRAGHERVARQILYLAERFTKRSEKTNQTMPFPLRHRHLAEATGLTSVHVSKVMTEFRRSGIIVLDNRVITIVDMMRFREIAQWH
jgi:CRP-like cAMP-binding protein